MKVIKVKNYEEVSERAAMLLAAQVQMKPDAVLGLATGSSPLGTYKNLVEWYQQGKVDFSKVKTVNLDEYVGLSKSDTQSYANFMETNLFCHINIKKENTHIPNGMAENLQTECEQYDEKMNTLGGVDLQLLGIGGNGHIGFNEPDDHFIEGTHVVELETSTIEANARFFEKKEQVPKRAITMGIGAILRAKKILLIASGSEKAAIIERMLDEEVNPLLPASILKLHPDCTIIYCE